jgi:hypothetical protein
MNSYNECQAIIELDLDPIKVKLMHEPSGEGWTLEKANAIETEYRRFLYLSKTYPNEPVAPSEDVDTFWHYHILDTMKYAQDCQRIFGYFLHHFPYAGMRGEDDALTPERMAKRTRALYKQNFAESAGPKRARTGKQVSVATADSQTSAFCVGTASAFCVKTAHAFCVKTAPAFCVKTAPAFCVKSPGPAFCVEASNDFAVRPRLKSEAAAA